MQRIKAPLILATGAVGGNLIFSFARHISASSIVPQYAEMTQSPVSHSIFQNIVAQEAMKRVSNTTGNSDFGFARNRTQVSSDCARTLDVVEKVAENIAHQYPVIGASEMIFTRGNGDFGYARFSENDESKSGRALDVFENLADRIETDYRRLLQNGMLHDLQ